MGKPTANDTGMSDFAGISGPAPLFHRGMRIRGLFFWDTLLGADSPLFRGGLEDRIHSKGS